MEKLSYFAKYNMLKDSQISFIHINNVINDFLKGKGRKCLWAEVLLEPWR